MKPIRILIIDDQYARDDFLRLNLITTTGITESGAKRPAVSGIEAVFCSGQSVDGNAVKNDYEVIADAVAQGWGEDAIWQWNLVLLDVRFDSGVLDSAGKPKGGPEDDTFGIKIHEWLRRDFSDLPVVMFSSKRQAEIEDHSEHYLSKDGINERELKRVLLDYGQLSLEQARHLLGLGQDIIFASPEMLKVYRDAYLQAESRNPVLILGESGSGKEVLAKYIHRMSPRKDNPFVALNMSAIPENLAEAELFGHEKGAFTGADKLKRGRFEMADNGTLFLDEIGDMHLLLQPKVLRSIQEGVVRRIGGDRDLPVDVRLISATHRNLEERIAANTFREDLFHRINRVTIVIPPLRKRRDDILPLAQALLEKAMAGESKKGISFSGSAKSMLEGYDFPGNVRELENMIEKLVVETGNHRVISAEDIKLPTSSGGTAKNVTQGGESSGVQLPTPTAQGNVEIAELSTMQPSSQPNVTLANLLEVIAAIDIKPDDPALQGIKPRVESAIQVLMQRCAGAALERCKKPMNDKYELQPALQLIFDDKELVQASCYRELDKIFGRPQKTTSLNQDDLKALVEIWKSAKKE
jgi:DNA-binding NtrC family response regulator